MGKELRYLRTILGRLDCSFAKHGVKLDRPLSIHYYEWVNTTDTKLKVSDASSVSPYMNSTTSLVEFLSPPAVLGQHEMPVDLHQFVVPAQTRALAELADSPMEKNKQS